MRLLRLALGLLALATPMLILQDCVARDAKEDTFARQLREAQAKMLKNGHVRS